MDPIITSSGLLEHWQGHRGLTRRVIAAFPEDRINEFAIGNMRPFGAMAQELLALAVPAVVGIVTGSWKTSFERSPQSRSELLKEWDAQTDQINALWPRVRSAAWQETMDAFGFYQGPAISILLYVIDNEVHHRGQGYVYLRALGIEPPAFPNRF